MGGGGGGIPQFVCVGLLSCMMQHHRFDPPWTSLVEGIFPLDVDMGSDSIPFYFFR